MEQEAYPITYGVLGLLAFWGPLSGYDMKRLFDHVLAPMWGAAQSQIYKELRRMKELGWVEMEREEQEARPDRKMYSITALWSAANQRLPVIFLIMNNEGYQILKNRLKAFHGNDTPIGMDFNDPPMDVTKIAQGFGVTAERVDSAESFEVALNRALAKTDGPSLLEVMVKKV